MTSALDGLSVVSVVPDGTAVRQGEVIIELDATDIEDGILTVKEDMVSAEMALSEARIALERAKADVEGQIAELAAAQEVAQAQFDLEQSRPLPGALAVARARVARAEASFRYAEDRLASMREMFEEGAVSGKDVRAAELEYAAAVLERSQAQKVLEDTSAGARAEDLETARAHLTEARVSHEQAAQSRDARIRQAESQQKAAQSALDALRQKLSQLEDDLQNTRITAPRDGVVFSPSGGKVEIGRAVWRGFVVAELADTDALVFQGRVREADSRLVALDQPARVQFLARPDLAATGVVSKVGEALAEAEDEPDVQYLEVEIKLDAVPPNMRPYMTGDASIEVAHADGLIVPRACLRDGKVVIWTGGTRETRSVDVLAADSSTAVIRGGLAEGEWILLNPEE
ncbi:MAG: HlyD family efflux transporter periplasmic adaptor subunit [Candidatus Brocadiaceae bacterium]|nr:HlyD family efflux transporter periplasmic adaptor subunit [Candidatus Brocadiaceae bacterium]